MKAEESVSSSFWKDRRVFITGASGLVGSWLVKELLSRSAEVVALIRDQDPQAVLFASGDIHRVKVVSGKVEDYETLCRAISENEIEVVFHLAAQAVVGTAYRSPLLTFESNIRGTYNLLEACRAHAGLVKRVVVASSDKAYGSQPRLPYDESMALQGQFPYDVSKSCTDLLARSYFASYGTPVAIARCGNIYGGGDRNWSRLVPGTIRSFLRQERPIIRSDGTYQRDYVYVKDVVHFYRILAENLSRVDVTGEAFNFSAEVPVSVIEMVQHISQLMGCAHLPPIIENSAKAEIHSQYLSSEKARRVLNWSPAYSLSAGLEETIAWYRQALREEHD